MLSRPKLRPEVFGQAENSLRLTLLMLFRLIKLYGVKLQSRLLYITVWEGRTLQSLPLIFNGHY